MDSIKNKLKDHRCLPEISFSLNSDLEYSDYATILRTMLRIRHFEERIADLVTERKIITPCHLYTGQEAVASGVCYALQKEDYVFGTHRSHGHYLAKGGNLKAAMAEIFGRSTGCSKGYGGSMHLCAPDVGILGTSSIVAGSMGISLGTALAESIRKSGRVTAVFHGDGVPEEGIWHEAANFAALHKLPILFVCENNLFCTHMPLTRRRKTDNILDVAKAHGFTCFEADGNNVLEVYAKAGEAVGLLQSQNGPCFLECRTYRWRGHVGPNYDVDRGLRDQDEIDAWKARCPLDGYQSFLLSRQILTEKAALELNEEVIREVESAVAFALASPYPPEEEVLNNVFKQ